MAVLVASPPYDVLTSAEARALCENNQYSFLHVDKAEIDLDPSISLYDDIVYETAGVNLSRMISDGVLIHDDKPMFYIYRLIREGRAQTGLVACCDVDDYLSGGIKKHELTRADKENDRVRHVTATGAHTGPIFMTYRKKQDIAVFIDNYTQNHKPVYNFSASDGVQHVVWTVEDSADIDLLKSAFGDVPSLYIADGHHRNAAAARVALELREKGYPEGEHNAYLAVLFPDDELYIMDYNRIVKLPDGMTKQELIQGLSKNFFCEHSDVPVKPEKRHVFGMYAGKEWFKLTAKPEIIDDSDVIGSLDVSILQNNLLEPIFGIKDPRIDKNIDFVGGARGLSELERRSDQETSVAFSLFPTSIGELMAIADSGLVMPPKSTWFEPKLYSGLFIHKLSE